MPVFRDSLRISAPLPAPGQAPDRLAGPQPAQHPMGATQVESHRGQEAGVHMCLQHA